MKLSFAQKEQFFHELTESLKSGRSLGDSLERKSRKRFGPLPGLARRMIAGAGEGSVGEYFGAASDVFSDLDREMVTAGAAGGRLEAVTGYLAGYYEALARVRRKVFAGVLYPVLLLHFAALVFSIPAAMSDGVGAAAKSAGIMLGGFYLVAVVIWVTVETVGGASKRSRGVDRWLMRIPVVGGVRVALVGSRFCRTLGILVRSGGGILRSLDRAGAVCGSGLFREGALETTAAVRAGEQLGEAVDETGAFPDLIATGIATGEHSGRLDDEMDRLGARYDELLSERLDALAAWIPRIVYFVILIFVGWKIIEFYLGYIGLINGLLDGM